MDSITQAALGALCGEMVLGRKLGYKAALWGAFLGTFPDLDVLLFEILTATEQLTMHRGLTHSLLAMVVGSFLYAWGLNKIHRKRNISYWRFFIFVFLAWSTHVLIDCFNTYGTQIMEPFTDKRYSISNIAIIDLFFLIPLLLGLLLSVIVFRKHRRIRSHIGWLTTTWLCLYFALSLVMKTLATQHFRQVLMDKKVEASDLVASPTLSNILLWRMCAKDDKNYYVSYWSIFDAKDREPIVSRFSHGHELEEGFESSEEFQTLVWFCRGWHKLFTLPNEPNSLYVAAINMTEVRVYQSASDSARNTTIPTEFRPAFLWKITRLEDGSYTLERPFKLSKDGWALMKKSLAATYHRVKGGQHDWMNGRWNWEHVSHKPSS